MAECPHCGELIVMVSELDETGSATKSMYPCPECQAVLGVTEA
jgi:predicted RNA-binding Zn-ribbon protein involved in translation (DUF1610 family)